LPEKRVTGPLRRLSKTQPFSPHGRMDIGKRSTSGGKGVAEKGPESIKGGTRLRPGREKVRGVIGEGHLTRIVRKKNPRKGNGVHGPPIKGSLVARGPKGKGV